MKNIGKYFTLVLLIAVFGIGLYVLFTQFDKMEQYLKLCLFVVPPMCIIMGGVAGKSIAQVIKGEKKIEEIKLE